MYSLRTSLIIFGMICTGAARSVGVKLLYQLGFDNYLFVALLYLAGQSLALLVYWVSLHTASNTTTCCGCLPEEEENEDPQADNHPVEYSRLVMDNNNNSTGDEITPSSSSSSSSRSTDPVSNDRIDIASCAKTNASLDPMELEMQLIEKASPQHKQLEGHRHYQDEEQPGHTSAHPIHRSQSAPMVHDVHHQESIKDDNELYATNNITTKIPSLTHQSMIIHHAHSMPLPSQHQRRHRRRGSKTGLTQESQDAVAWVHLIPWYLKPLLPGLFNLANAALKWASFIYVAASIAEMLMAGLELILSVCVARAVRKRQISQVRWAGVGIVAVGLWVVHTADVLDTQQRDEIEIATASEEGTAATTSVEQLKREHVIGALLIVGQCVTAVGQDMAEELFLQEADFPATLLLGMEGLYGLLFGIPLYLLFAPESMGTTLGGLEASPWEIMYIFILTLIFTVTGIFNIMTTGVTSSMTRNMWKNCRTILVWILGLVLYYSAGNKDLGEEWVIPDSFFILGGFMVMLSGIYVYYKNK